MKKAVFDKNDFLLPKNADLSKWAVIACDQYSSSYEYWQMVEQIASGTISSFKLILPEVYLAERDLTRIEKIHEKMDRYLAEDIFETYPDCFIYIERTLQDGTIRKGLLGAVDLEAYDFHTDTKPDVMPTEKTVLERIPPRQAVRMDASVELSHVILFCNDRKNAIFAAAEDMKSEENTLYDFDLMLNSGHIRGWLIEKENAEKISALLDLYAEEAKEAGFPLFVVGDGNHSLACAKTVYEEYRKAGASEETLNRARYASVELENIYDPSITFSAIHRILYDVDPDHVVSFIEEMIPGKHPLKWITSEKSGTLYIDVEDGETVNEALQKIIDAYDEKFGCTIDYIHAGLEDLVYRDPRSIGFFLEDIEKSELFEHVSKKGVYPRKMFSVGHTDEKRFYLEARRIR